MKFLVAVLVAACSKSPPCPTADKLGGSNDLDKRASAIIAEHCRTDGWPKDVVDCLQGARDEDAQERCLHALPKPEATKLKQALAPLYAEADAAHAEQSAAHLQSDVDKLKLDELVARAPGCAGYLEAVAEVRAGIMKCGRDAELEAFGLSEQVKQDAKELRALTDAAALANDCATRAKRLREQSHCK